MSLRFHELGEAGKVRLAAMAGYLIAKCEEKGVLTARAFEEVGKIVGDDAVCMALCALAEHRVDDDTFLEAIEEFGMASLMRYEEAHA